MRRARAAADREPRRYLYDLIARLPRRAPARACARRCASPPAAPSAATRRGRAAVGGRARDAAQRLPGPRRHRGRQRVPARPAHHARRARRAAGGQRRRRHAGAEHAPAADEPPTAWARRSPGASFDEFEHMLMQSLEGQAMELGWMRDNDCERQRGRLPADDPEEDLLVQLHPPVPHRRADRRGRGRRPADASTASATSWARPSRSRTTCSTWSATAKYGKEIGGDLWEGKRTLILAHLFSAGRGPRRRAPARLFWPSRARAALPREIEWMYELLARYGSIDHARAAGRASWRGRRAGVGGGVRRRARG